MRKILVAFDGSNYSAAPLQFALALHEKTPIFLTGVFLPQTILATLWSYAGGSKVGDGGIPLVEPETQDTINKNIKRFENYCIDHGIQYRVHKDYLDFAIPELKRESRFADLLILCSESFYANIGNGPNEFLKETLRDIECPVIIVPENFTFPASNVLSYDGHASSVHAIKLFSYLLPEFAANATILVNAREDVREPFPDEMYIGELVARHFPDLKLLSFGADPKKFFSTWLVDNKAPILVSGAFGGSAFHRMFHKSFIAEVIRDHKIPVFIAHT